MSLNFSHKLFDKIIGTSVMEFSINNTVLFRTGKDFELRVDF